ncbi:hypothetical protein MMAN_09770 [Mycobacterium mantenii]|uniref:Uncharacterized protein n=1 Tax=Mycobacterium mantenii TaxID=560555 RepID=A0ABM7JMX8_MYCNT|nr:hypothetical protein MMAN_09770 [Mycobacterium mantenii]
MKKIATIIGAGAAALAIATAAPATAAQGGFDHNGNPHAWIKVGYQEMNIHPNHTGGYDQNYHGGCPGVSDRHQCDQLTQGITREWLAAPGRKVGGYWAEYYPNTGALRSGTW